MTIVTNLGDYAPLSGDRPLRLVATRPLETWPSNSRYFVKYAKSRHRGPL